MKMIHLPDQQRVGSLPLRCSTEYVLMGTLCQIKIGRQTNAKTVPGERNAYFDSKVLSRTHAEIWEQGGKVGLTCSLARFQLDRDQPDMMDRSTSRMSSRVTGRSSTMSG